MPYTNFLELAELQYSFRILSVSSIYNIIDSIPYTNFLELAETEYSFRILYASFIDNMIISMSHTNFPEFAEIEYSFRTFYVSFIYHMIVSMPHTNFLNSRKSNFRLGSCTFLSFIIWSIQRHIGISWSSQKSNIRLDLVRFFNLLYNRFNAIYEFSEDRGNQIFV